jgi:peptidoglycan/LPS O-acetylase OafA/YrhL
VVSSSRPPTAVAPETATGANWTSDSLSLGAHLVLAVGSFVLAVFSFVTVENPCRDRRGCRRTPVGSFAWAVP